MMDWAEVTVLMCLSQFFSEELYDLAHDFDETHDAQYAEKVWWAFHDAIGTMPNQPDSKKAWRNTVTEKRLSDAWVRNDCSYVRPDSDQQVVGEG